MTTIEITSIADVRDGDIVTLRWEGEAGVTVTLEGPAQDSAVGDCTITSARFVSATREVPEWEPGTVYEITTPDGDTVRAWYLKHVRGGSAFVTRDGDGFAAEELASIQPVPDDAETLRAEVQRLEAEVERWKAEAEMLTAKVDRLAPLQEHENECAYRQRAEKAEAEVERLRAARRAFLD